MPNVFNALNVPTSNGVGTTLDVSSFGYVKTLLVLSSDPNDDSTVEFSIDGIEFFGINQGNVKSPTLGTPSSFFAVNPLNPAKLSQGFISYAAAVRFARVRRQSRFTGGTAPIIGVSAPSVTTNSFGTLNVPTTDTVGTTFTVPAEFGENWTFQLSGVLTSGNVIIEASIDGATFVPIATFNRQQPRAQIIDGIFAFLRVRRSTSLLTEQPTVSFGNAVMPPWDFVADWPIGVPMFIGIDNDAGDDSRTGFGLTPASAGANAIRTLGRLRQVLPSFGGGRIVEIICKRKAGGAIYLNASGTVDDLILSVSGYGSLTVRGTETNTTAGCTAFDGSDADYIFCGGQQVAGTNAAGYNISHTTASIAGVTLGSPISVTTTAAHNLATGDWVLIQGASGAFAVNGIQKITVTGATTFTCDGTTGVGAAWTSGGTVQRWKVTLAGGGAPGFTDEGTSTALLGMRLRGDANTTTAGLRNQCRSIGGNGVDTIIPTSDFSTPPAATDVFYIEEPGFQVNRLGVRGSLAQAWNYVSATSTVLNQRINFAGVMIALSSDISAISVLNTAFVHSRSTSTNHTWSANGNTAQSNFYSVTRSTAVPTITFTIGGNRFAYTTLYNCTTNTTITFTHVTFAPTVATAAPNFSKCNLMTVGSGVVFTRGALFSQCGTAGASISGGQLGDSLVGNSNATTTRNVRSLGPNSTAGSLFFEASSLLIHGVDVINSGAAAGIVLFGVGGNIQVRGANGSKDNTGLGISLAEAAGGNATGSVGWNLIFTDTAGPIQGTLGGLGLPVRAGTQAPFDWTDFENGTLGIIKDSFGNTVRVSRGVLATNNKSQVLNGYDTNNITGGAVAAYRVWKLNAAEFQAVLAQADTTVTGGAANTIGLSISRATIGGGLLCACDGDEAPVLFDRSGAHPAPAVGGVAYLSVDTPGLAQADVPAIAVNKQKFRLGYIQRIHPSNTDIGIVKIRPDTLPILADGLA